MSNIHRIIWLDQEIRSCRYPNTGALAKEFEISTRQAARDIEYLRDSLCAPLRYDASKRGFLYLDHSFVLPNVFITEDERKTLYYLAYKYGNYDGTPLSLQISRLFKKLTGNENIESNEKPVFDIRKQQIDQFNIILNAIKKKSMLSLVYTDPEQGERGLTVHPCTLYKKYKIDYFAGVCEEYGQEAAFRLDRIKSVKLLPHQSTQINPLFPCDDYQSEYCLAPFEACIEFKAYPWGYQCTDIQPVEDQLYLLRFQDPAQFIAQLLAKRDWIQIRSPSWLIEKLKDHCRNMLDKLDNIP